ncbi:hypothetical protein BgiBS90_028124, partial [Biomphalaria glabrata]
NALGIFKFRLPSRHWSLTSYMTTYGQWRPIARRQVTVKSTVTIGLGSNSGQS